MIVIIMIIITIIVMSRIYKPMRPSEDLKGNEKLWRDGKGNI